MTRSFAIVFALLALTHLAHAADVGESYMKNCAVCHLPGIAGAPKVGDKAAWTQRLRKGMNLVYRNALEGMANTAMMAKGGHTDLSDAEVKAIVDYMVAAAALDRKALALAAQYDRHGITDMAFVRLDKDFDGFLTPRELVQDTTLARSFARFDADRDGRLSESEYRQAEATLERERAAVMVPDESLVQAVRASLAKVRGVDLANTRVEAERGVVAMVGIVEDAEIARQAQDFVKRIPGVKRIDNRLISGHQMGWD